MYLAPFQSLCALLAPRPYLEALQGLLRSFTALATPCAPYGLAGSQQSGGQIQAARKRRAARTLYAAQRPKAPHGAWSKLIHGCEISRSAAAR